MRICTQDEVDKDSMMTAAKHTNVFAQLLAACCIMQVLTQTLWQLHVPNDGVLGGVAASVTDII